MKVEIWSDIACPWCYVGKRRFEAALKDFPHADDVTVTWRSFELDPQAPAERPGDRNEMLARKYGTSVQQAQAMHENMTQVASAEGLDFRFGDARSGNTFDGHRVIHLAARHGLQDAMKERLLKAQFTDGELVSDHATLIRLAVEVGLPRDEVVDLLAGHAFTDEVREDEITARQLGISGVPFFVVDRTLGVSGAQDPEVFAEMLRRGWEAQQPPKPVTVMADGGSCGPDGC